jgi:opacity protein-like surface antigen
MASTMAAAVPAFAADDMPPEFRSSTFEIYVGAFGAVNMIDSTFRVGASTVVENGNTVEIEPGEWGYLDGNALGYGLRGGVDYVMDGFVLGAVADWSFGMGDEIAKDGLYRAELNMPHLATIRARAGYTAGTALFYVTGGYAQAELELKAEGIDGLGPNGSNSDWTAGWTLGAGVDIALTEQVSMGLEYLYVSLDDVSYTIDDGEYEHDLDALQAIRLGLNYAFSI